MKRTSSELRLAVASLPPTIFQVAKIATLSSQRSVMAMLSSIGRSEHLGNARGNDRCSLYCDHGRKRPTTFIRDAVLHALQYVVLSFGIGHDDPNGPPLEHAIQIAVQCCACVEGAATAGFFSGDFAAAKPIGERVAP
jgi:hypothetical protein